MKEQSESDGSRHRIVIVGAGPGGICAAIKLKAEGIDDFVILERGAGIGGTWFNNRYPGLTCDVPSLVYSFSFERNTEWTRSFAAQDEIETYMQNCARKYDLERHIRLEQEIVSAFWSDEDAQWTLRTTAGTAWQASIFVSAVGMFNAPHRPDIPGLDDFAGELLHTAHWTDDIDVSGKRVGVIGSAASATQIVPEIAETVTTVAMFQRTPNWVLPKDEVFFSEEERAAMRDDPSIGEGVRGEVIGWIDQLLSGEHPELSADLEAKGLAALEQVIDPQLREKLRPRIGFGAQRPLFSDTFYTAFNRQNVELVTDAIECVVPAGVATADGRLRELDMLVLATGYEAFRFLSVIDVSGRDGVSLSDLWADGAHAYLGVTVSGFPNLFMLYGPNTNAGPIINMLESQVNYIADKIRFMDEHEVSWLDVRPEAMDVFNEELQAIIATVEILKVTGSKYFRSPTTGRVVTQWPKSMAAYEAMLIADQMDAFEVHPAEQLAEAKL